MDLTGKIRVAENTYVRILEDFFSEVYDEKKLLSHGIYHHRRVWGYAKELLVYVDNAGLTENPDFLNKLLISCYLHDIGMTIDNGVRHGMHSRKLCENFLVLNHLKAADYQDVLNVIENHDNKDYSTSEPVDLLFSLLSVADDLDALGNTGIYRYIEVYIARGLQPGSIGLMIRDNARKRFDNFLSHFGNVPEMVARHKIRFHLIDEFFENYNKQVRDYRFGSGSPHGNCGVAEIIMESVRQKIGFENPVLSYKLTTGDPVIRTFFDELAAETAS